MESFSFLKVRKMIKNLSLYSNSKKVKEITTLRLIRKWKALAETK